MVAAVKSNYNIDLRLTASEQLMGFLDNGLFALSKRIFLQARVRARHVYRTFTGADRFPLVVGGQAFRLLARVISSDVAHALDVGVFTGIYSCRCPL